MLCKNFLKSLSIDLLYKEKIFYSYLMYPKTFFTLYTTYM